MRTRPLLSRAIALTLGSAITLLVATTPSAGAVTVAKSARSGVRCVSPNRRYRKLAGEMAAQLTSRVHARVSSAGLALTDSSTGVRCWYHSKTHFYAASVMKVTILAALLRKAQEQHRHLTEDELHAAWLMITQSDNDAANTLWFDVGHTFMVHFLKLAKMSETELNEHWGLTLITAHDQLLLLSLISDDNPILNKDSRVYARYLMAHVTAAQRWGVPAGAPRSVLVHVKNGWLPYPGSAWEINSIGTFTTTHRSYLIAMLTYGNPSMEYGIDTIESAAEVIQHKLNPGKHAVVSASKPGPSWGTPDEVVPSQRRASTSLSASSTAVSS